MQFFFSLLCSRVIHLARSHFSYFSFTTVRLYPSLSTSCVLYLLLYTTILTYLGEHTLPHAPCIIYLHFCLKQKWVRYYKTKLDFQLPFSKGQLIYCCLYAWTARTVYVHAPHSIMQLTVFHSQFIHIYIYLYKLNAIRRLTSGKDPSELLISVIYFIYGINVFKNNIYIYNTQVIK